MKESAAQNGEVIVGRWLQIFLVAVIGMAFVGFVVGMRQGATVYVPSEIEHGPVAADPTAVPAKSYRDFDRRRYGPNAGWQSTLADLAQPEVDLFAPVEWNEEARAILRAARDQRRAFEGAPPVVPHPIDQMTSTGCLACHGQGLTIAGIHAPAMSHELLHNCTQCHVEQVSPDLAPALAAPNLFVRHEMPLVGSRAWAGAPPTIPHPTFMRENCMSCHGATGPQAIRSTHPWRANCMQCHAPSALRDQAVFDDHGAFLPPPRIRSQ